MKTTPVEVKLNRGYRMQVTSKGISISILTAIAPYIISRSTQNRDSKCFGINFHSLAIIELYLQLFFTLSWSPI